MTKPLLLQMSGIDKSFNTVRAVQDVSLQLNKGEVLALLGENGAGKSTMIKILGGVFPADKGTIKIDGQEVKIQSPIDSQGVGISIIYQEFNLVPFLNASENIFLGRETSTYGFLNKNEERDKAKKILKDLKADIPLNMPVCQMTIAQQQIVEIAKALSTESKILVMDEPSAVLSDRELVELFRIINNLKEKGIGIIYISHRLEELFQFADRVMVMRDGKYVDTLPIKEVNKEKMIQLMVGRHMHQEFPSRDSQIGEVKLQVRGLNRGSRVKDVSFDLHQGEILGLAGLVGAGRTETARLIFGADDKDSGQVILDGKEVFIGHPADAIKLGFCLLTEDRKTQGLILNNDLQENFSLPNLDEFSSSSFMNRQKEQMAFDTKVEQIKIKSSSRKQLAKNLSGGNQQKVVLAKWLQRNCDILIFDEPTRGIDVGAKYEIYTLINELVAQGKSILFISSEIPEILGMCDRVLVMHEGRITGEIKDVKNSNQEDILSLAVA
jgi:ABC-type sugar transport system ATPase subunit